MPRAAATSEVVSTQALLDWVDLRHLHALTGQAESDFATVIVKELVDNAIDAAEQAGRAPQIGVDVVADDGSGWRIAAADNGRGLTADEIEKISDFATRASSKDWCRATFRGQQGNAWKTILGIPVAYARAENAHARSYPAVEIVTAAGAWDVGVEVDGGAVRAVLREKAASVGPGVNLSNTAGGRLSFSLSTRITCHLPAHATVDVDGIRRLLRAFLAVNPHLALTTNVADEITSTAPTRPAWKPHPRSSIRWYTDPDFARLCDAGRQLGWPVSRLVGSLAGFTAKAIIAEVLVACGITPRSRMVDLAPDQQVRLLQILRGRAPQAGPDTLTAIGRSRIPEGETTKYAKVEGEWTVEGAQVPFLLEAALTESNAYQGEVLTAINYSPSYVSPWPDGSFAPEDPRHGWFQGEGLNAYLASFHVDELAPVRVLVHLACPRLDFRDRGKSVIESTPELQAAVSEAIWKVARTFHHKEEAHRRRHAREQVVRQVRWTPERHFTELAARVIPNAYAAAAGSFPFAFARQIFYKARPLFQAFTSRDLKDSYFIQTLLPDFQRAHPDLTAGWTVLHDPRGHLWEPHGGATVPLGTEDVDAYLRRRRAEVRHQEPDPFRVVTEGPGDRYGTVLFIEKEGFRALLEDSGLLNEFDVALMSTKGISTTAARTFLQGVQGRAVLLALHDFDVSGMSIVGTLSRDTERFQFTGPRPEVIDIGLRLDDVREHNLSWEHQAQTREVEEQLRKNSATDDEIEFLQAGKRVELNAFGNDEFVVWVRSKLKRYARKLIPSNAVVTAAYRDAQRHRLRQTLMAEVEAQVSRAKLPPLPRGLRTLLKRSLAHDPHQAWDEALGRLHETGAAR